MTVASTAAKAGPYTGNDVTSSFAFSFKVFADTDIRVVETLISTGIETDLVLNDANGYTVTRNADQDNNPGGTVTYKLAGITAALPSTKKLTIVGDFTFEQPTDLPNGGPYFASVVENSLDRLELHIKQLKEVVDRAVVVDVSSTDDPDDLIDSLLAAADAAAASATAAAASAATAAGLLDDFDDLYLGAKAVAPTLDNDGDALVDGALYWDTTVGRLFGYRTATASWVDPTADAADVTYTTPSGTITDVEAMLDKQAPRFAHHNTVYDYTTTTQMIYDGSTGDGLHRHFGQYVEGIDGRRHLIYGRSPTHGTTANTTAWHRYSDDGGETWSAETEVVPANALLDQRSMSMCVTPTGRIIIIYAKVLADGTDLVTFGLRYSDDNGVTWTQGTDIVTINFTYCRAYGRIKLIPGDSNNTYRLAWTPYYRSGSGPATYKVAVWYSDNTTDGLTWTEGTPIVNDTSGQTECELVAINALIWFAVTRGGSGLTLHKSVNGGSTWASVGVVPLTSSDSQVAPTLDKFPKDGSWFIALSYCNRAADEQIWRVAAVAEALTTSNAFGSSIAIATDMVNASGYQCPLAGPDGNLYVEGGTSYVEFKEYVGQVYTQVRLVRIDLLALIAQSFLIKTVASGAVTIPGNTLERNIALDTEGAAATDDLDTINGGNYGQVYVFHGPQTTSSRDVTLKNGTGNLHLWGDFRINTLDSWLAAIRYKDIWVEIGRTNDDQEVRGVTIAGGIVTVPSSRLPLQLFIDTEGGAATDDLDTILGGIEGQIITFFCPSSSRDVTFKDGTGNMNLAGDFISTAGADKIMVQKQGVTWYRLTSSDNA